MTEHRTATHRSLTAHVATIDVAQRLLKAAGPKRCGGVRQSEFDALIAHLDDLRDLVTWLDRHQSEFREWRNEKKKKGES